MRNIILLLWAILLLLPLTAFAEIKTITHTVQQPFGGSQSPDDARTAGIARAKREALEQFGTYIESSTVVKNSQVDSDEILALTAGVTKAEVIKQKNYTDGDAFGLEITVKVELDTAVLDQSLKRLLQDRNHLNDLTDARVREKQLLARIVELEKQNKQQGRTDKQKESLKKEFQKTRDGLTAVEWFDRATALWDGKKVGDPLKAIEYLTRAIKLDPKTATTYSNRGVAYDELGEYQLAIADYDQAVQLNPNHTTAYYNRGNAYYKAGQFEKAIADYTQVIRINPNDAGAYNNRGIAYSDTKKYQSAIEDFNQVIRLEPNHWNARMNRGAAYHELKLYQDAISDYDKAIKINSTHASTYYNRGRTYHTLKYYKLAVDDNTRAIMLDQNLVLAYYNRGLAKYELDEFQPAIADFDQVIRLNPSYAMGYYNRSVVYLQMGQLFNGCRDAMKACQMGACGIYEYAQQKGFCR